MLGYVEAREGWGLIMHEIELRTLVEFLESRGISERDLFWNKSSDFWTF
jgi:hypothetical protein